MSCDLEDSQRVSVRTRAQQINERLQKSKNVILTRSKSENFDSKNNAGIKFISRSHRKNLVQKIESVPETLAIGGERCGTKLQVNGETGADNRVPFDRSNLSCSANSIGKTIEVEENVTNENACVEQSPTFADCSAFKRKTRRKVPKIERQGESGEGAGGCHPTANHDAISVPKSCDGAPQPNICCDDLRKRTLSDILSRQQKHTTLRDLGFEELFCKEFEGERFDSYSKYVPNSPIETLKSVKECSQNCVLEKYPPKHERPSLFQQRNQVSSYGHNILTRTDQACDSQNFDCAYILGHPSTRLGRSSRSDCDSDSFYDSSDSLLTTESIDQILCSCEKIRDEFQTETTNLLLSDLGGSKVRNSDNVGQVNVVVDNSFVCTEPEGSVKENTGSYRAQLVYLEQHKQTVSSEYLKGFDASSEEFHFTNYANDVSKMESRISPFHFNQRRSLKTNPALRSYGSVSGIPTTTANCENSSPKVQVRHKPDLPAYLTLGRKSLRKALSDPCEIADDRTACSSPEEPRKSEISSILAELDFSKFKAKDEELELNERLKNLSERPLLQSIERLGLKPAVVNIEMNKEIEDNADNSKVKKLRELTEKLKTQDLKRPKVLQRSQSITPASVDCVNSSNEIIRARSSSLPRRPYKFLRSASYAGTEESPIDQKTGIWSPGMFSSNSGGGNRKENRYLPLKGSVLPSGQKLALDSISNVPIKCPIRSDLLQGMSELSVDSAVESVISDEGLGIENEIQSGISSTDKKVSNKLETDQQNGISVPTRNSLSPKSQEQGSSSFAEKRKRRKGMIFNGNNDLSFDLTSGEGNVKANSSGRSLTFPPQRKGSNSDEPLFTSVDSNGMKSLNADQEVNKLQVSELSLADSHICPSEVTGEENYHDVVRVVTRQSGKMNNNSGKPLKKKHYSDPSGEKCGGIGIISTEGSQISDELTLPDIMLSSKSEPELGDSVKNKRNADLRLHIQDSAPNSIHGGSQPNSPPVIAYDPSLFPKSNTIGPMTAPIRFDDGNGFDHKFYSLTKSPQQSRRYSKKRLRGPYGEMLEEEMRKSGEKQQQKLSDDLSFLQELIEPQRSYVTESVSRRRNCASIPVGDLSSNHQRSVDDIHLQRSHSDTGTTPKRKISTNIPPLPVVSGEPVTFLSPPQISPSISVPNIVSISNSPEWSPSICAGDASGSEDVDVSDSFLSKFRDTRTHVVGELYDTEKSYVESLQILVKRYFRSLKSAENAHLVDAHLVEDMFYRVPEILVHHEAFLEVLTQRLNNWDSKQKVGDLFVDAFTKQPVIDTYTAFINNWKSAKEAIKSATTAKPAFAKFLEHMSREHKGKLTLDALLIMPVQRIPRYELLIKELLKHTQVDHPDHHPLVLAQKEVHDLALKINHMEREAQEAEQMLQKLRDLENLIEGLIDLVQPDRTFIRHDYVTMAGGLGTKKERCIFLFSDLLIITSIKRKTGTIRKTSSIAHSPLVSSTLEMNKYKLLMRFSLDDLDITKNGDVGITKALKEIEHLEEDIAVLGQMSDTCNSLNIPHQNLDEVIRELLSCANKQLTEKHSSDSLLLSVELTVTTQECIECFTLAFSTPDRRTTFEADFDKAKQKLALTTEKRSPPEFLYPLPIRKTRSGLEFTCVAGTIGLNSHDLKDVWICNSDGYIGQVCILSLQPDPTVTSCNGVCNSRILCIASIPATNSISRMDVYSYRRRSTMIDKNMSGIRISVEDVDDLESRNANGNFQLDSDSSEDEEDSESQDEELTKQEDGVHKENDHQHHQQQHQQQQQQQATMWLGTEDGYIHIYNCQDNIRIKKNKFKIQHGAAITCIIHLDNRVFVSLANGELAVYSREKGGGWNTCEPQVATIGSLNAPVTKMLAVAGKLWCGCQNNIIVVNTSTLAIEETFSVVSDTTSTVLCMVTSGLGVWISIENSAVIKLFHATSYQSLFDVNVAPTVTKMLAGCDDIIRQHKAACLRVISLLTCKDLLWVGTSAGVILTLPLPHLTTTSTKITTLPNITGIPHGHTGHVRFLTCVEMTPGGDNNMKLTYSSGRSRYTRRSTKSKDLFAMRRQSTSAALTSKLLVISGGYGYEDFRNTSPTDVSGREDSTNHVLLWQV